MGDENSIRTLGDYSRPSHEGYRNTIKLPEGNNVSIFSSCYMFRNPFSSTTIGDENPIRTLGDYSKPSHEGYMNTIELPPGNNVIHLHMGGSYYPIPCLILSTGKDRKTAQRYPDVPTTSWRILSEAWTRFKDLLQKVPHHGIDLWLQVQIFYDHVNPITRRTIDQSAGGKLRDLNTEESWALLEDIALYDNESWNDPRDFTKPDKEIALPQDVPSISDRCLIELENQVQRLMEAYLALTQPTQAITDQIAGTLPSDTVKNPKLGTHPVSSARSYPTIEPQCSSHPSTSINAIKAHFKEATISQTSL
ncbi:hypothetical protein Tco_1174869 [Tanacetum coccineum]